MRPSPSVRPPVLAMVLLLLAMPPARADCSVAQTGTLWGQLGVYTETLRPGQRWLRFTIPPVCLERNGVRAVACETVGAPGSEGDENGAGDGGDKPLVELDERQVAVTRSLNADGFAMLSVELYCAIAAKDYE